MPIRAPSSAVNNRSTTMRRRSGGAMTFRNGRRELSYSSSHSQPNMSMISNTSGSAYEESPINSPTAPYIEEANGYHIYSSLATSDGAGDDTLDPPTLSSADNEALFADSTVTVTSTILCITNNTSMSFGNTETPVNSVDPSEKGRTACNTSSSTMLSAIDSGRRGLIPSINTTVKFTHKWPRPQTMKYFDYLHHAKNAKDASMETATAGRNDQGTNAPSLEEGQGRGLSHIAKWTPFKWCLLFSVATVFTYGCGGLIVAMMTWFNTWQYADVMVVADNDILILITMTCSMLLFTSFLGLTGTLLNSRPILAVYALLMWPAMVSLLAVGYMSYRRYSLSLEHKLNLSWSRYYTPVGRQTIQDSLKCCGFYSAMHEATPSKTCYLRAALPGCKAKLFAFERANLQTIWATVFSLLPLHLVNIVITLLCANHATSTFGKGIIPVQYRLTAKDVKADADRILSGAAGIDVAKSDLFRDDLKERVKLLPTKF